MSKKIDARLPKEVGTGLYPVKSPWDKMISYPPSISRNTANTLNLLTAGKRRRRVENSSLKLPYSQGLTDAL